jgi:hypothetical protein
VLAMWQAAEQAEGERDQHLRAAVSRYCYSLVARGVYSHGLATDWLRVEYILMVWQLIGRAWSIFSWSGN